MYPCPCCSCTWSGTVSLVSVLSKFSRCPTRPSDAGHCARLAGLRWHSEHPFEAAMQEIKLDDYWVRSTVCWYRNITLAL